MKVSELVKLLQALPDQTRDICVYDSNDYCVYDIYRVEIKHALEDGNTLMDKDDEGAEEVYCLLT